MTRIDLRDNKLDTIHQLVGGGYTGDFTVTFKHASLILGRQQARAIYDLLQNEFADEYLEPEALPFTPRKAPR